VLHRWPSYMRGTWRYMPQLHLGHYNLRLSATTTFRVSYLCATLQSSGLPCCLCDYKVPSYRYAYAYNPVPTPIVTRATTPYVPTPQVTRMTTRYLVTGLLHMSVPPTSLRCHMSVPPTSLRAPCPRHANPVAPTKPPNHVAIFRVSH